LDTQQKAVTLLLRSVDDSIISSKPVTGARKRQDLKKQQSTGKLSNSSGSNVCSKQ